MYEYINGTLAGDNLAYFFLYANTVTNNMFGLFTVIAFFLIVLVGSVFAQLRTSGRLRPETSFLAASFVTLGFATILEQYSGILSANNFYILIAMTIIGLIWVAMTSGE